MTDETKTECKHNGLVFWSGGFYIACANCNVRWVAIGNGKDTDIDHNRRAEGRRETPITFP